MKKIIALLLVLMLLLGLAACGEPDAPSDPTGTPTNTPTNGTTSEPTNEPTNEPTQNETDPPHVHSFGDWTQSKAPSCTEAGEEVRSCSCGETETRTVEATGHSFGDWTQSKTPTCTEKGEETRSCGCGASETREVEATGHNVSAASCTEPGTCSVCGWTDGSALGHDYTAKACGDPMVCSRCGEGNGELLPHDFADATCTAAKTCKRCSVTEGSALGHSFGEWKCTKQSTCTAAGKETRSCKNCSEKEERSLELAAHDCKEVGFEGDCTKGGYILWDCANCDYNYKEEAAPQDHTYVGDFCSRCKMEVDKAAEAEKASKYEQALNLLSYVSLDNSNYRQAYELLTELGNYKEAAKYLSRFTVIPNVKLSWSYKETNAFGEVVSEGTNFYCYDAFGNVMFRHTSDIYTGSSSDYCYIYRYDQNGLLAERIRTFSFIFWDTMSNWDELLNIGLPEETRLVYTYSPDGLVVENATMQYGTTKSLVKYFYDDAGRQIRAETMSDTGAITITDYVYNDAGLLIRTERPSDDGVKIVVQYEYDAAGNRIKAKYSDYFYEYEYDANGQMTKQIYNSRYGEKTVYNYFYENGQVARVETTFEGENKTYVTYYNSGDYYCYSPEVEPQDPASCNHRFSAWITNKMTACGGDAQKVRSCEICGTTESKPLTGTGHIYTLTGQVEATLETKGSVTYTCGTCGHSFMKEFEYPDAVGLEYKIEDLCGVITGIGSFSGSVLKIPKYVDGYYVQVIEQSAFESANVTEVYIPDGVYSIEEGAFKNCRNLSKVYIPDSIYYIKKDAFEGTAEEFEVFFEGTTRQWEYIDMEWWQTFSATYMVVHCSDGDLYYGG